MPRSKATPDKGATHGPARPTFRKPARKTKVFWTEGELKMMHDHINQHSLNGESELTRVNRAQKAVLAPNRRRVLSIAKADKLVEDMADKFGGVVPMPPTVTLEQVREIAGVVDAPSWDVEMTSAEMHKFGHLLRAGLLIKVIV